MNKVVIGTRGSALALCQAEMVEAALEKAFPDLQIERRVILTTGDRRTDVSLNQVAKAEGTWDKGVFIKKLEVALHAGEIDIAVHSLKDLPTVLEDDFALAGMLERAPVRDVFVSRKGLRWQDLQAGQVVGTSSVRRARQVEFLKKGIKICDLRGNVPTRLRKLADSGVMHGILLAEAGMHRLGYVTDGELEIEGVALEVHPLPCAEFFPSAGQGAVALEIRAGDDAAQKLVSAINHAETQAVVTAEREFLRLLDGGCHTPIGVWSEVAGEDLKMAARVFPEEEGEPDETGFCGKISEPLETGKALFGELPQAKFQGSPEN